MKKHKLFYFLLIITLITMAVSSISILAAGGSTSAPWYVGLLFPACCLSIPLFFYSLSIKKKFKSNTEFYIALALLVGQITLLFV